MTSYKYLAKYYAVGKDMAVYETTVEEKSGWKKIAGGFVIKIQVSRVNGKDVLIGQGQDKYLYKWTGQNWIKFTSWRVPNYVVIEDEIFGLSEDGKIYKGKVNVGSPQMASSDWEQLAPGTVSDFAVRDDFIYGVGTDRAVWKHSRNGTGHWQRVTHGDITQVEVDWMGDIFGLGTDKCVYKWMQGRWHQKSGGGITQFALCDARIHGLHEDGAIRRIFKNNLAYKYPEWEKWTEGSMIHMARTTYNINDLSAL